MRFNTKKHSNISKPNITYKKDIIYADDIPIIKTITNDIRGYTAYFPIFHQEGEDEEHPAKYFYIDYIVAVVTGGEKLKIKIEEDRVELRRFIFPIASWKAKITDNKIDASRYNYMIQSISINMIGNIKDNEIQCEETFMNDFTGVKYEKYAVKAIHTV